MSASGSGTLSSGEPRIRLAKLVLNQYYNYVPYFLRSMFSSLQFSTNWTRQSSTAVILSN